MRWGIGVLVMLAGGCATLPPVPKCPELPPRSTTIAAETISPRDLQRGDGGLRFSVEDLDGAPAPGRWIRLECDCLEAPADLRADAEGKAHIDGLPAGQYTAYVLDGWTPSPQKVMVQLREGATFRLRVRTGDRPLVPSEVLPADALAADVVLEVTGSGCLGPCRSFVAVLRRDDRLQVTFDEEVRSRRVRAPARRAALSRARCLVEGPSYTATMATDFRWLTIRMRRPDGTVGVYRRYSGDFRVSEARRDFEDRLLRALRLPR